MTKSPARADRVRLDSIGLLAVFAFALTLRATIADIPLERDEGEYAYIAQRWLRGDLPYRDAFDQKPPGVFLAYAAILSTIGQSPEAIHWGAQIYTLGTLALVYLLGRRLFSSRAGLSAAALTAFLTADSSMLGNAANTEIFMLLPLTAAFLTALVAAERQDARWAVASGAASAAAILLKQVSFPNALLCFVLVIWQARRRLALGASFCAGAAITIALPALYFVAARAWPSFFDCVVAHNLQYSTRVALAEYPLFFFTSFGRILTTEWPIYALAAVGVALGVRSAVGRSSTHAAVRARTRLTLVWTIASFAGIAASGHFREHYFLQIVPGLSLLAGQGAAALASREGTTPARTRMAVATTVPILYGLLLNSWYFLGPSADAKCVRLYGSSNPFVESRAVAKLIAERTTSESRVFILGSEPQILFHAERRSASRYIFLYPLVTSFPDARERQLTALDEIRAAEPAIIVAVFSRKSIGMSPAAPTDILDGVRAMLERDYRFVAATRLHPDAPARLIEGEEAAAMWEESPVWYDARAWCSLAIWERRTPAERGTAPAES